ncbi:MAG: hypothetical protein ACKVZ6_22100 [Kineosporiaceae bacterium]
MTLPVDREELRALVREALRDALPELVAASVTTMTNGTTAAPGPRVEDVRVADDADLAAFATRVLDLADDVRSGRVGFRLTGAASAGAAPLRRLAAEHRIDTGAVSERHVRAAERAGARLVLGPRAVLTPLARDRVRASGVEIVRETPDRRH